MKQKTDFNSDSEYIAYLKEKYKSLVNKYIKDKDKKWKDKMLETARAVYPKYTAIDSDFFQGKAEAYEEIFGEENLTSKEGE